MMARLVDLRPSIFNSHTQKIDFWSTYPQTDYKTVFSFVLRDFHTVPWLTRALIPYVSLSIRGLKIAQKVIGCV